MQNRNFGFSKKKLATLLGVLAVALVNYFVDNYGGEDVSVGQSDLSRKIIYTHHARCRMKCREISKVEVRDVIKNGIKNRRKSNHSAKPCPVFAMEKKTEDGQLARVVYAGCPEKIKIITVIDLNRKYNCSCK